MSDLTQPLVRAPWPDELSRTWRFLQQARFTGRVFPRIAVTGPQDRIVGAVALEAVEGEVGRIHLTCRPRFCQAALIRHLLQEAETVARKHSMKTLRLVMPQAAPWLSFLGENGFTHQRTDEWWMVMESSHLRKRTARAYRLANSPKLSKHITTGPLTEADYPAVMALAREHGLADLQRIGDEQIVGGGSEGYSHQLSTIIHWQGEVAGIFLVRDLGDKVFVHIRAVAKRHAEKSGMINAHFMARVESPEYRRITGWIFSGQPDVEKETIAMAKRFGGSQIGRFSQYKKPLA